MNNLFPDLTIAITPSDEDVEEFIAIEQQATELAMVEAQQIDNNQETNDG